MILDNQRLKQIAIIAGGINFLLVLIGLAGIVQVSLTTQFGMGTFFIVGTLLPLLFYLGVLGWGLVGLNKLGAAGRSNRAVRVLRLLSLLSFAVIPLRLYDLFGLLAYLQDGNFYVLVVQTMIGLACQAVLFFSLYQLFLQNEAQGSHLLPGKEYTRTPRWHRLTHLLVDSVCVLAFMNMMGNSLFTILTSINYDILIVSLAYGLGYLIYYVLCESVFQQTLGKALMDTRVFFHPTASPKFWTILKRSVCRFVPFEGLSIFNEDGMWHDEWSDTEVLGYSEDAYGTPPQRDDDELLDAGFIEY